MGAANHRGTSKQDYATPWEFVHAVEAEYGPIQVDLAADEANTKCHSLWYGEREDSLRQRWCRHSGLLWLNPPFGNIRPWAEKCAHEWSLGANIALLVPASVDSEWFANYVHDLALVRPLRGARLCFDGRHSFPKPLMLCLYGESVGFSPWRWRDTPAACDRQTILSAITLHGDDGVQIAALAIQVGRSMSTVIGHLDRLARARLIEIDRPIISKSRVRAA